MAANAAPVRAPGAVPIVNAPPLPIPAHPRLTYTSYYNLASNDPYGEDYTAVMQTFAHGNGTTGDALLASLVCTAENFPTSCMGMYETRNQESGTSLLLSGVRRYAAVMGRPTPWDGQVFAFAGDVAEGEAITVHFPDDGFDPAAGGTLVYVPDSPNRIDELLANAPDAELLGPFVANDPRVVQTGARNMIYVPPRYIPIVAARRLTPKQLWTDLVGAIRADNNEANCASLINWVIVSLVRPIANEPGMTHKEPVDVPLADRDLIRCRKQVLWAQLPDLKTNLQAAAAPAGVDGVAVTAQLVQFVGQLVTESRQARVEERDRADEKRAPKSPSAYFGEESCRQLCVMCNVGVEAELPPVWHALSGAGKKDRAALEHALNNTAHAMGTLSMVPIATPDLTKKIVGLRFAGDDVNSLSEGIQPFAILIRDHGSIGYMSSADEDIARRRNAEYDILTEGSISTTLQDIATISTTSAIKIPTDYTHLRAILQAYAVLITTLLGPTHVLSITYQRFVNRYSNEEVMCRGQLQELFQGQGPGRLLRFIQLHMVSWFRKVKQTGVLPTVPNFDEALDKLTMHVTGWAPELPRQYLITTIGTQSLVTADSKMPPTNISSGSTTMSGLTAPSTIAPNTGTNAPSTKVRRLQVTNLHRHSELIPFGVAAARLKLSESIEKAGEPPAIVRAGITTPMCLSYHVRGSCWNSCTRQADHVTHTAAEDKLLLAWCSKAFTS